MATDDKRESLHEKVRGLLNKAESTPFEAEAAAFYEKAQQLIAKHAIDEELLWANDPRKREEITTIEIEIKDKVAGAHYRRLILHAIADAHRSKMWYMRGQDTSVIAGYPSDLAFVEMLYSSILTHLKFRMATALAKQDATGRTFRKDFTAGYSDRICERIREHAAGIAAYLRDNEEDTTGSQALVLRDRKEAVLDWVDERYDLRSASYNDTTKNWNARSAGNVAANTADITGGKGKPVGNPRKALGR